MKTYVNVGGRLMQRQPCQQQQGASIFGPAPPPSQPTLLTPDWAPPAPKVTEEQQRAARWADVEKNAYAIYDVLSKNYPNAYPNNGVRFKVQNFKTDAFFPGDHVNSEGVDAADKLSNTISLNGKWVDSMTKMAPDAYHIDIATAIAHGARHLTQSWPSWIINKPESSSVHQEIDRNATDDVARIRPQLDALQAKRRH